MMSALGASMFSRLVFSMKSVKEERTTKSSRTAQTAAKMSRTEIKQKPFFGFPVLDVYTLK